MPQCRKKIGNRRCKASCVKGTHYCVFHSKKNSNSVARRKVETKELSAGEKFVIKQAGTRLSKIAGEAMIAKGVYNLLNPEPLVTTVIEGRYVPQSTITANERFLSESKFQKDVQSAKQRHVKLKVKGKAGPGKRYRSRTTFVRADRSIMGRVKVKPTGRDFLHSIEDFEQREIRQSKARRNARLTVMGGATLRYGVPALIVGMSVYDVIMGRSKVRKDSEAIEYGLYGWAAEDAYNVATIVSAGQTTSLLTAGNFTWGALFG